MEGAWASAFNSALAIQIFMASSKRFYIVKFK